MVHLVSRQVAARVVHQLGQHAEGQRAQLGLAQLPAAHQHLLAQQRLQRWQAACRALCSPQHVRVMWAKAVFVVAQCHAPDRPHAS